MALNTQFYMNLLAAYTGTALDLSVVPTSTLTYAQPLTLATGTGANQADKIFLDQRTITASGTDDLDLAGVLTDPLGATVTFARIKGIVVYAAPGNTNNVIVGGAASNQFINWVGGTAHTVNVRPGGLLVLLAPDATAYAVTAGTGDLLRFTNSAGTTSVIYDVVLIGSSV